MAILATKTKFTFFLALALCAMYTKGVVAMQGVQTDFERLGIGIASLASKECEGYDLGNAAERVILELGGTTPKMRAELLEKAEADARKFLTSQHKSLCDVAAEMTDSGDFLVRL